MTMSKNILSSLTVVAVLFAVTSCEDYVKGVSEFDPTLPRDADVALVINAAEVGLIGFAEGDLARLAGIFTGQFSGSDRQYVSYNNYVVTALDFDTQWGNIYATVIKSLRIAEQKAQQLNNKRTLGMAQIMEAYTGGMAAALFGDIPFTQAANIQQYPNPAFESQLEVYQKVLALLDQGIANIASDTGKHVATTYEGDIFGGGDEEWLRRAHTIKAKFHLHLKQYQQAIDEANLGIASPSQDLLAPHGSSYLQNYNIYYSFLTYDRPGYMTADGALAPTLLDPSSERYRGDAKTDETGRFYWYYYPEGLNSNVTSYDINVLSSAETGFSWGVASDGSEDGFFAADASFPIVTFAENQLILAEALLRNGDPTGALGALNSWRAVLNTGYRISAAWQEEGLLYEPYDMSDFSPGGIQNPDGIPENDALYREIIEEKYISLLGQLEVFNDMRRMGYGTFASEENWQVLGITPNSGSQIPQRFLIPQTEINSNTSTPKPPPGLFEKTQVFGNPT
jgi:hypothetical protein